MFINNVPNIKLFRCKSKIIANYLVYYLHLSTFSIVDQKYGFIYTEFLKNSLKKAPIWIKILITREGLNGDLD